MAKLPRFSLAHNEKTKKWELKTEGSSEVVKKFAEQSRGAQGRGPGESRWRQGLGEDPQAGRQDPRRAHLSAQRRSARL